MKQRTSADSRGRAHRGLSGEVLYRRVPWIVCYWRGKELIFENYLTRRRIAAAPQTCTILDFFDHWRSSRQLFNHLNEYSESSLSNAIALLMKSSFLQQTGGKHDHRDEALRKWGEWNPAAAFFHLSTKDVEFEPATIEAFRGLQRLAKTHPLPLPIKRFPKSRSIALPRSEIASEFPRILLGRRTWRKFSARPVGVATLGTLLGLTWGVQGWAKLSGLGSVALKTSPSGGALHPVEAYVLVRRVEGLQAGLYHYAAADHRLELMRLRASSHQITKYLAGQWWFAGASFVVLMTAVFGRTQWKYDYARAYRAVLMEAGHLCQTFCLTATWLDLAPFCTIAFDDSKIEKALGVDGVSESVLYAAGAGVRPADERRAHLINGKQI